MVGPSRFRFPQLVTQLVYSGSQFPQHCARSLVSPAVAGHELINAHLADEHND